MNRTKQFTLLVSLTVSKSISIRCIRAGCSITKEE